MHPAATLSQQQLDEYVDEDFDQQTPWGRSATAPATVDTPANFADARIQGRATGCTGNVPTKEHHGQQGATMGQAWQPPAEGRPCQWAAASWCRQRSDCSATAASTAVSTVENLVTFASCMSDVSEEWCPIEELEEQEEYSCEEAAFVRQSTEPARRPPVDALEHYRVRNTFIEKVEVPSEELARRPRARSEPPAGVRGPQGESSQ